MGAERLIERLESVKATGDRRWQARCPAHDDRTPSLSITETPDGTVLLKCFAGCSLEDVLAEVKLTKADLFAEQRNGHQREIAAVYGYTDEDDQLLFEVVRFTPKDFRQRRPDGAGGWQWKLGDTRRVLYRLPEVINAAERGDVVYVTEGERDVHALEKAGETATTCAGGAGRWKPEYSDYLRGARVVVVADRDEPGRDHARQVAESVRDVAESVTVVESKVGSDASDHLEAGEPLDAMVDITAETTLVSTENTNMVSVNGDGAGRHLSQAGELLHDLQRFVGRFMCVTDEQVVALALWVLHTHAHEAAHATPYLSITSAERSCGKTQLLEVLELVVARPWLTGRTTAAVLPRKIDGDRPTLLLDESDMAFKGDKDYAAALTGVLNSGYRPSGRSTVCVGQGVNIATRDFSTYCAKAIAGIGNLPDTVASRSIHIRLKRKAPDERIERFRQRDAAENADTLRAGAEAWAAAAVPGLTHARPELPDQLSDRGQDVWEPLLAIADLAGEEWPQRARAAAIELAEGAAEDGQSRGELLLADLRAIFDEEDTGVLPTDGILSELNAREESPWGGWSHGNGFKARDLARHLKRYGVRPRSIRIGETTRKGYRRDQFAEAWRRYLPPYPETAAHPAQAAHPAPHEDCDVPDVPDVPDFGGMAGNPRSPEDTRSGGWTPQAAADFINRAMEMFPGSHEPEAT